MDARQAHEWGLSKSRPLKLWQWYKHELLVYCCICRVVVKSETWNCVCTRPLLVSPVTYLHTLTMKDSYYLPLLTWLDHQFHMKTFKTPDNVLWNAFFTKFNNGFILSIHQYARFSQVGSHCHMYIHIIMYICVCDNLNKVLPCT